MATTVATRTAREYLRVSKGKGRTARSITDQHLAAADEHGPWTWGEPYKDTGSASKFGTKARDDFEKLLADLRTGAFGKASDILVLWEISRLARETGKGVEIVDRREARGYMIHITSHERTYNPENHNDRHELIKGIADEEKEARLLSKRTKRGTDSALSEGRLHGKRPFGYARRYEVIDGRSRPVEQYPDADEAPLVVELFERVAGWNGRKRESIRSIALDWERRGIVSREKGVPISANNLRPMLLRKAYIGVRVHGTSERPGNWEPLIDSDLFDAVQAILADPSRKSHTTTSVRHVLTGTLRCDVCGNGMTLTPGDRPGKEGKRHGRAAYICRKYSHTRIDKADTDALLIGTAERPGTLLAYLSRPDVSEALVDGGDDDSELSAVRSRLGTARAKLEAFEGEDPETPAEARLIGRKIEKLEAEIKELEQRVSDLSAPNPLRAVFAPGPDAAARWEVADVTVQRAIAALLFAPHGPLGQPRVRRFVDSASEAVQDRLEWVTDEAV